MKDRQGEEIITARCQNCGSGFDALAHAELVDAMPGGYLPAEYWTDRVEPGDEVPLGECPHCGALVLYERPSVRIFFRHERETSAPGWYYQLGENSPRGPLSNVNDAATEAASFRAVTL